MLHFYSISVEKFSYTNFDFIWHVTYFMLELELELIIDTVPQIILLQYFSTLANVCTTISRMPQPASAWLAGEF